LNPAALLAAVLLLQQPGFLWRALKLLAAAGQPVICRPLCAAASLLRSLVNLFTTRSCKSACGLNWLWAEDAVQQLQNCGVAAGLLPAVPGANAAEAAAALFASSSSSSSSSTVPGALAQQMCIDIRSACKCLVAEASTLELPFRSSEGASVTKCGLFLAKPATTGYVLQLLASCCMMLHEQHVQYQQQQQQRPLPARRLGSRMRGDLLLLLNPQQQLLQLLPGDAYLAAMAPGLLDELRYSVSDTPMLLSSLDVSIRSISGSGSSSSSSSPVLSAAALQLFVQLLLRAAAYWQQRYHSLTAQQQALLKQHDAAVVGKEVRDLRRARDEMSSAKELILRSSHLLHKQIRLLWGLGQWQPQMQLLQ
jgi:hypothetical protein